jgi:hypothetical protein
VWLQQTRSAVADQQSLEDSVAAHGSEIIGKKKRRRGVVQFAVEGDHNTDSARHGPKA